MEIPPCTSLQSLDRKDMAVATCRQGAGTHEQASKVQLKSPNEWPGHGRGCGERVRIRRCTTST